MKDHISVCICTYRRNKMLENLVRTLSLQVTDEMFEFSIVIIDNDAQGPAQETVNKLKELYSFEITYEIEPTNTIPAARNHALKLAKGNYIAIIDDDEFAPRDWLINMYQAILTFNVDGALGPVFPFYEKYPPKWLVKSGLCERPVIRTGTLLHWNDTRTGNVLLKKEVFEKNNLFFDLNCKTSGSDKEFFREAMDLGCRFIAVEEAPVYEIVTPERQTKVYYFRRNLIQASNERRFRAPLLRGISKISAPIKKIFALIIYTIMVPICAVAAKHLALKFGLKVVYHLSWLLTMIGFDFAKKRNI